MLEIIVGIRDAIYQKRDMAVPVTVPGTGDPAPTLGSRRHRHVFATAFARHPELLYQFPERA
ncbi:MAG: hypothetical protein PVJ74_07115, partial [Gammaproteobacteria bacterium]